MNLVALFEEALEFQNFNGTVLSNGKVKVYYIGRTSLADIYNDVAGEYPSENPKILNNLGMGPIYVNPAFDYEIVVYDEYDNELFSVKKYLHSSGAHSTSNVEVVPSENIGVSAWTVGEVQIYQPYLTGQLGKVYTGIEPIVVNNVEDKISANHVPLGLQEPLFFVQDDENGCIIGCSAQTEIPSSVSSKWEDASDTVSNNSAQWGAGTVYTPGNYIDIQDDVISVTGLQPAGDYAYNSAVSSKLDTTAFSTVSGNFLTAVDLTPYQEKTAMTGYLTTGDSAQFYTNDNPSGFITGVDLSDYATTGDLANKLDTTAFSNVSGDFITALPADLVYTGDLTSYAQKDFVLSAIDSSTSGLLPTSSFSSVSGSFLTALPSDLVYTGDITGLATTAQLSEKLDSTAFSTVSSTFLTAHQDISDLMPKSESANFYPMTGNPSGFLTAHQDLSNYQTIEGMTAYQEAGEYYSASNPSGFITGVDLTPYQTTAGMTAYQSAGDYLTTADSAQFITALPADLVYTADITGFATTADLTSKLDKSDSANFLLTGDSANFYTTANESGYLTAVPNTYLQNTDLSTTDGKVTAISGIPLSAGGASYTSPSGSIWISADNIESTDSAYIPSHQEDVLLTATTSWSSMKGYATLANTNKVYFITEGRGSAFDNEGTFLNSSYNSTVSAETEYPPIKLYTDGWVSVRYSAYSAGITDAYVVELARKNEVNSALNTKLDTSAFTGYYPSNNPSGFAKASDVVPTASINLFDGKIIGIKKQYLMGCDSAYNYTLAGSSAATGSLTASAYVGTGHQGVTIEVSGRQNGPYYINWTAFDENGSNLSTGQMAFTAHSVLKVSAFEFNSPLAENISGVKLYGNSTGFTAYSAYTSDVKPLASQDNLTFLSGAIDHVSANSANWNSTYNTVSTNSADWSVSEEISGINGIKISESADKVIIEVSADYYLASNPSGFITGINYNTGSI